MAEIFSCERLEYDPVLALQIINTIASSDTASIFLVDEQDHILWCSQSAATLFHCTTEKLLDCNIFDIIHNAYPYEFQEEPKEVSQRIDYEKNYEQFYEQKKQNRRRSPADISGKSRGKSYRAKHINELYSLSNNKVPYGCFNELNESEFKTVTFINAANDKSVPIELTVKCLDYSPKAFRLFIMVNRQETEQFKWSQELQQQRFKLVSDAAPVGILQADRNWEATYVNEYWCQFCGLCSEEVLRLGWVNSFSVESLAKLLTKMSETLSQGRVLLYKAEVRTPLGKKAWVELRISPIVLSNGSMYGFVAVLSDISSQHVAQERLRVLAEQDYLTGLANNGKFKTHLKKLVDTSRSFVLFCIDLDGFKLVNDSLGHDAGDLLLIEVANRLTLGAKKAELVARVGGDEFMVVLQTGRVAIDHMQAKASALATVFMKKLLEKVSLKDQEVNIGASIGISFYDGVSGLDVETLIKRADVALYHAKSSGRNNYKFYDAVLAKRQEERQALLCDLKEADQSEFLAYYQVQSNVSSNDVVGVEALLRWDHPELGLLGPETFIPLLESSGQIARVSHIIWHKVLEDLQRWKQSSKISDNFRVSINVSAMELLQPDFWQQLMSIIKQYPLCERSVTLEITESTLLKNSSVIKRLLSDLINSSIKIALDDFGTGNSSLIYLRNFPINYLKIDQVFVSGIDNIFEDEVIIESVIRLAKFLNLEVCAEGVENHQQLSKLNEWGCDYYQGYLLNRPCSALELEALL